MADDTSCGDDEIRRLQGSIDGLIRIQALPGIWSKRDPSHIVNTSLDVLVSVLHLDFAYARLGDSVSGSAVELVRLPRGEASVPQPEEIGRALARWVTDPSATAPVVVPSPVADGEIRIAPIRLGLLEEIGVLIAGSTRTDFPTQTETLLLRVAANQVLAALQEARQENGRKRTTEEVERRVAERTSQLTAVKNELAEELSAMTGLYQLSTRLLANTELRPLLEEVLDTTITLQNADFGNLQFYNPKTQALEIVAQRGFRQDFLDHFASVHDDGAACGRAMNGGERVIVEDVLLDPTFAPHRAIAASAGFRAVQSTPLLGRGGKPLGMISTHFRQPHRPSERELRLNDLYIRRAAELIEHKRAEEALRVSEERFRGYFELGLIGMAITSPAKSCLEVNDELCRILGYERSELLQMNWAEITHPDDLAADIAQFSRVMAGEIDGYTLDKRWICKHGHVIDSIMAAKCLRRDDGSVDYFVGLVLDTTERKRTEEKLRTTLEELTHVTRNTAMGELAASIAHEINQPLGAIINNSNVCLRLLADQFAHDADGRDALRDIVHDAERASAIIARIREMTTRTLPKRTSLQLRDVMADVLALAHRQLAEHRIETLAEIPEDLPRVLGDRVELQQVFLNLIINGLEAMSALEADRRVLTIRGDRDELHGNPAVRISVQDLGCGVAPADMTHLFEAFYTTKPQGMGMGLRIGTSIVEALGGRLSFAPNDGPGVTFSCLFPAENPRPS